MSRENEHFISADQYFFLRNTGIPYEGYVEGMGYVSQDIVLLPPAYFAYENPPRSIYPSDSLFIKMEVARLDNREESVARSYRITPQEISEKIVQDGYVIFPGGNRIDLPKNYGLSVEITTEYRQGQAVDSLSIKVEDKDTGDSHESTQTMASFLKGAQTVNSLLSFTMSGIAMTDTPASFRIYRNKGETFSPKIYKSGWTGGSAGHIKTIKVLKAVRGVSEGLFVANFIFDGILLFMGEQNFTKMTINTGVGVLCLALTPGVGLIVGISYFVLDQCGLIDPIADYVEDIFTHRPIQTYRTDPSIIVSDKTKVVIDRKPLPIILKAD